MPKLGLKVGCTEKGSGSLRGTPLQRYPFTRREVGRAPPMLPGDLDARSPRVATAASCYQVGAEKVVAELPVTMDQCPKQNEAKQNPGRGREPQEVHISP